MAARNPVTYPQLDTLAYSAQSPSNWCLSRRKRLFDVCVASALFAGLLPLMALIAVLVRLTSRGPILFSHMRCGLNDSRFSVLKFRTMRPNGSGPSVTRAGDTRITPVGVFLRKWKLDELPQLINVIRGDMSLVGPRPDVPEFFAASSPLVRQVLRLKPGVTGWASIRFRNEEELLAQAPPDQLNAIYVNSVLPRKARLDLDYASRATFFSDFKVLLQTASAIMPFPHDPPIS